MSLSDLDLMELLRIVSSGVLWLAFIYWVLRPAAEGAVAVAKHKLVGPEPPPKVRRERFRDLPSHVDSTAN